MSCPYGACSATYLSVGLPTIICIVFLVICLFVKAIGTEEYVDTSEIKESSSYKTIYESEITPSNNFLLITSSETPFLNPFYTLLINNKKGYVYGPSTNPAITSGKVEPTARNNGLKSLGFAQNIDNLERSNKAAPERRHKPAGSIEDESNYDSDKTSKRIYSDDDSSKLTKKLQTRNATNTETASTTPFTISTVPSADNLGERIDFSGPSERHKNQKDLKYIYRKDTSDGVKKEDASTRTDFAEINNLGIQTDSSPNTLDACCSAMTFKQIARIVQTESVSIIDRTKYKNGSTSMSMHVMGRVSVYTSTSTPKCFNKCMQVDSGVLGTRRTFKNRSTSVTQVNQLERRIQTDSVRPRMGNECHKKYVTSGAVHANSSEKCEICQIKRIMNNIDRTMRKDKSNGTTSTGTEAKQEHSRAHCSSNCKRKKGSSQSIEQRIKKIGKIGDISNITADSSNGNSDVEVRSNYVAKEQQKSWKNDPKYRQALSNTESSTYIASFRPQNVSTDNENSSIIHQLSLQAERYLDQARKTFKKMKENDPTVNHYRNVKNDILQGYPQLGRKKKVTINESDSKIENDIKYSPKSVTEIFKRSETEVTIKNAFPELNVTIKGPSKNWRSSKIRVRTRKSNAGKLVTSSKKTTSGTKNVNISGRGVDITKTSTKRDTIINSNTEMSVSEIKLHTNQSTSVVSLTHWRSQKGLKQKCSCATFKNDKQGHNLTKTTQRTIPLSHAIKIPKIKQTTVYPRYNVRTYASRNLNVKSPPTYPCGTSGRTNYMLAPLPDLPVRKRNICEKLIYRKCEVPCNNAPATSSGNQPYWTCCHPQSSPIRSTQMYSQCCDKKPTCKSFYQCNLGNPSGQCAEKRNCEDNYNRRC